jgi:hypothetical protein
LFELALLDLVIGDQFLEDLFLNLQVMRLLVLIGVGVAIGTDRWVRLQRRLHEDVGTTRALGNWLILVLSRLCEEGFSFWRSE